MSRSISESKILPGDIICVVATPLALLASFTKINNLIKHPGYTSYRGAMLTALVLAVIKDEKMARIIDDRVILTVLTSNGVKHVAVFLWEEVILMNSIRTHWLQ